VNDHHGQHPSDTRRTKEVLGVQGTGEREFASARQHEENKSIPSGPTPGFTSNLSQQRRDLLKRYGLALALSSLALFLRGVLPYGEGVAPYQLSIVAVVLSAWYGGRGPGWFASLISVTGVWYLFVPPVYSFRVSSDHALGLAFFIGICVLLTEFGAGRRRVEHALRVNEERFRTLVQFSFDVYWETDALHRFTHQEFSERLTDAPAHGAEIGKTRWEIPYLEPDEEAWRKHRDTMDAHLPFRDFELARPSPAGGKRYVSVSGMPMFDQAGRFVGYRGVGRHITEQKRAEAELRARQEMLDLAQAAARAVAFDWHIGARENENRWSPELEALYGLEPGTFDRTYQGWKKLVHPDDWPAVKLAIERAHESGDVDAEYRVIHKDGTVHWLRAKGRMFFDTEGRPERMVGFMLDVTGWRYAEEELRASEARFRTFVDRATDAFFLMDEQIRVVDVNRQACDSLGRSREELIGMHPREFDVALDELSIQRLAQRGRAQEVVTFETRHRRKDGTIFPVEVRSGTFEQGGKLFYLALARDISERKHAEEEQAKLAAIVESSHDAIIGKDLNGIITTWNTGAEHIFGYAAREVIGQSITILVPPDRVDELRGILERIRSGERVDHFETVRRRKDGTLLDISLTVSPIIDGSGNIVGASKVARDISERKLAEESLRQSETYLTEAQRLSHTGSWAFDVASNRYVYTSEESDRIFGIDPHGEKPTREVIFERIHPEDRSSWKRNLEKSLREKVDTTDDYRVVLPDGTVRHIHTIRHPVVNSAGEVVKLVGTSIDITERKLAEESLRQSEAYLTEAQRLSHTGSWALDVATNRYVYTSEEFDRLFGFDSQAEAPTREAVLERMHPDDRISWKRILEKSVGEKVDTTSQYRIVLPDGTVRHIHTIRHPVVDSTGKVVKLVGTSIDITERKHAEEELRASEKRFRTFVDRATDAFFLMDDQARVVDVNRQACDSLGLSREELIGIHPREFDAAMDEASIERLAQRARAGEVITFETRHRRKDGTTFPVEIRAGTFQMAGKLFSLALARDITERKLAEETLRGKDYALQMARTELAHVSRLTTLGELTTSIVHEVSQPLAAMINSAAAGARWLAAEPPDMAEARSALDNIAADGKRAREVIARIRGLTKRQAPRMGLLDLNRKIVEVVSFAEHELRSHDIVLETKLDSELPQVTGDRVQLQQVLLNLIINAIEAMSAVNNRPRELTIVSSRGADGVVVEVRDSGVGLEAQHAERVFKAFYTTKSEGIGIGLSISRSIVEAHGGQLSASANEPHGAVFRFSLPVAQEGQS
jgi:PAS domain S-box-containing protein